jgi:hypothetical protein
MQFVLNLNPDQRREVVNTSQRFSAWHDARRKREGYRGSLVWHGVGGSEYLVRSYYDSAGRRRQKNEGLRSPETERLKNEWDRNRASAEETLAGRKAALDRQAAVNRALKLGRVPTTTARVLRAVERAGLLGRGIRVVDTNALYSYEAAAGVFVDPGLTTTEDIDLLLDARRSLKMVLSVDVPEQGLITLLQQVDRSFERTGETFRAANRDGFLVDLIKPSRNPPWIAERETLGQSENDLVAVSIEGLTWLESAPPIESIVIDERGAPLRMASVDPRAFAIHKLWLSAQPSRGPVKRKRDRLQAQAVAKMVATYLKHLPLDSAELRMFPREVVEHAQPLFVDEEASGPFD